MNKIVIELSEEDRKILNEITTGLTVFSHLLAKLTEIPATNIEIPQVDESNIKEGVELETEEIETVPVVSLEELQQKAMQLVSAGKKDQLRAVVSEYAEKLSGIPENKRAEVLEKLNALEG